MRGFPFMQLVLVTLAVLLAAVPVYRLTRPVAAAAVAPTVDDVPPVVSTSAAPIEVEAVFAPAPTDFQIKNLDRTVLAGRGPSARFTAHWTASVPPEGADFVVQAHWPRLPGADAGGNWAAARVTLHLPDGRTVEKSFWADATGALADVLTLPGATPAPDAP